LDEFTSLSAGGVEADGIRIKKIEVTECADSTGLQRPSKSGGQVKRNRTPSINLCLKGELWSLRYTIGFLLEQPQPRKKLVDKRNIAKKGEIGIQIVKRKQSLNFIHQERLVGQKWSRKSRYLTIESRKR